jgi:orotidine-5'-phosphate decarboxylase
MNPKDRIILALDVDTHEEALKIWSKILHLM